MAEEQKKFLDAEGVAYLWKQLSLEDYPNNATLVSVINAIDNTKADKEELTKYLDTTGDYMTGPLGLTSNVNFGQSLPETSESGQIFFLEDETQDGNDYAEYRECNDNNFKPGQVVCENGDDKLILSTERLQPCAWIISNTYGCVIGKWGNCPVAVAGRALAYTYEPREEYKIGDCVCAGPNGTVSKMTRDEIKEYPDRIIGTVCSVPDYKEWGHGITVDNRIWIKV